MDLRILNKKTDLEEINSWLPFKVTADDLPGHTYCCLYNGKIAATAGLRLIEGTICLIDSMATDQSVPGEIRHQMLDRLTATIIEKAKELGFKKLIATTEDLSILERAKRHGFSAVPQLIIVKEL